MSATPYVYSDEKVPEVEVLPAPATSTPPPKRTSFTTRLLRLVVTVLGALVVFKVLCSVVGFRSGGLSRPCHGMKHKVPGYGPLFDDDGNPQHPFPPIDKWEPFNGTTHFEFEPAQASGLSVRGARVFGKVVFETSKFSNKIVIDLDIKTNKKDKRGDVTIKEDNGYLTIDTPSTGKLKTHTAATIQIPSNIIGEFALPKFEVDVPRHMVDFSQLPESLEIGAFAVRVGRGFVKPGPVHTNTTTISIGNGALRGTLTHARNETNVDIGHGNATLNIPSISSGNEGSTHIHLGHGHLNGTLAIYNATSIDVGSGGIYVNVAYKSASPRATLSTRIASGNSRVFVDSIAAERVFDASHASVAGDQLITYPANFQGTVDARGIVGDIKLEGKELAVEKVVGGMVGRQGDSERNSISVKTVRGKLDILVGDESAPDNDSHSC
ncbi:uncharacterized protein Z520_07240 [Fonsecaea multimorphosa CBS 102226]|uniref:Uncharacterized protein n=1 Tax=Fonsecaea multimorphosa CBS 102226 TaxID=1442371 RepID=A0A0D2IJ89_9EURO|nr:uncharacterized protein Z520_07240 [Fonsecaea multimorphosa CBS 102226]KIX97126.1 hypothetical protein Z520_07240 [Fonsecaea multimorphosa CBS 102226]OAL22901.1 hypothetical protein AYO22_06809 [Fonsecaea multimorphosa]